MVFAWALRLLLLAGAGGALAIALVEGGAKPVQPDAIYACPMHPGVRAHVPGPCPICGMALVAASPQRENGAADDPALAPIDLITVRPHLFPVPIRAPAWIGPDGAVVARFYRDEAEGLSPGIRATFTAARPLSAAVPVALLDGPPQVWDGETLELRFRATAAGGVAHGNGNGTEVGSVAVEGPPRPVLTVDESVVFTADDSRYVLVADPGGRSFERRAVEIGRVINGRAVVVAGLAEGDRVVRRRAFFLDADQRAREASLGASPRP
ncbi:MAG TPA: heavy metal-binding domain-containing protein [Polyangia bacterium]|nr:heavy metal-binding domain-containing protein [Polyangia bacterium]